MKVSSPPGLDTLLATGSFVLADLYDFALTDGLTRLRYTSHDVNIALGGNVYSSKGPFFDLSSQSRGHWKTGLDVDTWQVTVTPAPVDPVTGAAYPARILGQPWLAAVRAGILDGAVVHVHRAYKAAWSTPFKSPETPDYTLVDYFLGRVAAIDVGRTQATISINSYIEVLARPMPRNLWGPACRHTLFDVGCTLNANNFVSSGTVTSVITSGIFNTDLAQVQDYFSLGYLKWLTGNNVGFTRAVRQAPGPSSGSVTLIAPMPFAVQVGDTFSIFAGCDKTLATCTNKFNNRANFGGQPFIPAAETAV